MKTIKVGLDIGVSSVGFAVIEYDDNSKSADLLHLGVRIISEDPDFHGKFYTGNSASKNAGRRLKRMIRRGYNRYQDRKRNLIEALDDLGMLPDEDMLTKLSSLEIYELRAKGLSQKLSPREFGRVLLHLNNKRGFLSSRKSASKEENESDYLKRVHELEELVKDKTIGQFFLEKLQVNPLAKLKQNIFPRKEYQKEFDLIWIEQSKHYPELLTGGLGKENKGTTYRLIRDEIIFYQRPLKSQKGLVSKCRFEPNKRVTPKSHPFYQEFRIWQQLNNLVISDKLGYKFSPSIEEKNILAQALQSQNDLTPTKIFKYLKLDKDKHELNYEKIEGNKTYLQLHRALTQANIPNPEQYLFFNRDVDQEKGGLLQLWHITYSLPTEGEVKTALMRHFNFSAEQAKDVAAKVNFTSDFGSLSNKAIRKILPGLLEGLHYDKACAKAGYQHTEDPNWDETRPLKERLDLIKPNTLRNPVVEQILNQVVNVVNEISSTFGKPDEVRVEMARELKSNAKQRDRITKLNKELQKVNKEITEKLQNEHNFKRVNGRDLLRYRLWDETNRICLYSGKIIPFTDVYNGQTEIEHILPKTRSFSNGMSNLILAYTKENKAKDQQTALDYMASKGSDSLETYTSAVQKLYKDKKISRAKFENLLCKGEDIPNDFLDRQLKDTQYIARETITLLKTAVKKVTTTTGSVTDFLREKWELNEVMQEINLDKYRLIGKTKNITIKDKQGNDKPKEVIEDWSKRDDHRHHAVDALVIALTNQSIIQKLNNLNQQYSQYKELKESILNFPVPVQNLRHKAKEHLNAVLISFKKPNSKVLTKKVNKTKAKEGIKTQVTWVPRGSLHEDTVLGKMKWYERVPLNKKFDRVDDVVNQELMQILKDHLQKFQNDPKQAFGNLERTPVLFKGIPVKEIVVWQHKFTKRVELSESLTPAQVGKILDKRIKELVLERIEAAGNIKLAFKEYRNNPIYLDQAQNIPVYSVSVADEGSLTPVRKGFVYTKGNHHAIIYADGKGNFAEKVVSFWEAVARARQNIELTGKQSPVIDLSPNEQGWPVYTTLQINDLFVFDLDPKEIDFFDPKNRLIVSKQIFRVQALSSGDYRFRHHLETKVEKKKNEEKEKETTEADKALERLIFKRVRSLDKFNSIVKVRVNKLGKIIWVEKQHN
jgi:CRISPR-associated endonuclease Csn1